MTGLQTLCLFATGYLMSRLLLAAALHQDLVRWLLSRTRGRVSHVVLGVMVLAFALSMVVPNALTVLALLPVLALLRRPEGGSDGLTAPPAGSETAAPSDAAARRRYGTLLAMALIYGANLGGVGSLLGSPANLYLFVSLRIYDVPGRESLHFVSWLAFGLPMALTLLLLLWGVFWVTATSTMTHRLPPPLAPEAAQGETLPGGRDARRHLALRFLGIWGLGWAALLATGLALGRPSGASATPILAAGTLLGQALTLQVLDAVVLALSIGFGAALLAWPVHTTEGRRGRLLTPRDLVRELPWRGLLIAAAVLGLLVLLAQAGAAAWLQEQVPRLLPAGGSPLWVTLVLVNVTIFATEVLNNTTVSTVLFPIAAAAAPAMGATPLTLMLGVSLASTCAFMTPVATPVNALALASLKGLSLRRFVLTGLVTNLVAGLWISLWLVWAVPTVLRLFGGP